MPCPLCKTTIHPDRYLCVADFSRVPKETPSLSSPSDGGESRNHPDTPSKIVE